MRIGLNRAERYGSKRQLSIKLVVILLMVGLLPTGCDHSDNGPQEYVTGAVTLKASLNITQIVDTRSLEQEDENSLKTLDVLVFDSESDTYLYRTFARRDGLTTNYTAPLSAGDDKSFRFVLLANCREEINRAGNTDAMNDALPAFTGLTRQEVMGKISFTVSAAGWNTSGEPQKPYTPLPMWGESALCEVGNSGTVAIGTVRMLRSVARIDVGANIVAIDPSGTTQADGLANFQLTDIKVYNQSDRGWVSPLAAHLDAASPGYVKVTAASIPSGTSILTASYHHDQPGNAFIREIYLPETLNHEDGSILSTEWQCFVLVAGYYSPNPAIPNTTERTWYRVDLCPKADTAKRFDLLRNYCYTINIASVKGPGFTTPEDAALSKPDNIEVQVISWDGDNTGHVITDGKHYLSVDKELVKLYQQGGAQPLVAVTDFAGGWKAEVVGDAASWLKVEPATGIADTPGRLLVSADELDMLLTERIGEILLTAGRLKKTVQVVQTNESDNGLSINPSTLIFRKSAPFAKRVMVNVFPADKLLYFTESKDVVGGPVWRTDGFPTDGTKGPYLSFQPEKNNTGRTLNSVVTVYTYADDGSIVGGTLRIQQLATDVVFETQQQNPYPAAGGNCQFKVTAAETSWQIVAADPQDMLKVTDNKLKQAGAGQTYPFYLYPNQTWEERRGTFHTTSPDLDFVPQDIVILQEGNKPALTDFKPTETDFSLSTEPKKLQFDANCNWTATADRWIAVDPTFGEGGLPYRPQTEEVLLRLAPVENLGVPLNDVPAAGLYSGVIAFATRNHGSASPMNVNYPYKRMIPSYFTFNSASPTSGSTIPWTATDVTVDVSTNTNWSLRCSLTSPVTGAASTYGQKQLTLTIPANLTSSPRTVTIDVYNGETYDRSITLTQEKTGATVPDLDYIDGSYSRNYIEVRFKQKPLAPIDKIEVGVYNGSSNQWTLTGFGDASLTGGYQWVCVSEETGNQEKMYAIKGQSRTTANTVTIYSMGQTRKYRVTRNDDTGTQMLKISVYTEIF